MIKSDAPCRITGLSATKIVIEAGPNKNTEIGVSCALIGEADSNSMIFGTTPPIRGGWPKKVAEAAAYLIDAIEDHLVTKVFEEDEDNGDSTPDARRIDLPPGLVGPDLGTDEEGVGQL
jgi:hypothetical protein